MSVHPFPPRRRYCIGCGVPLHPAQPFSHRTCRQCWNYSRIAAHVAAVRRLLVGAR